MVTLGLFVWANLVLVHAEELVWLSGVFSSDIMKCGRGDVVGLALANQTIVIQ